MLQEIQNKLNEFKSLPQAAIDEKISYRVLQREVLRGRVPSLTLPGNHRAVHPDHARAFAEMLRAK